MNKIGTIKINLKEKSFNLERERRESEYNQALARLEASSF